VSLSVTIRGTEASFFDSEKVIRAVEKGTRRSLSRCGAFVRTTAKSSIRYGEASAKPGEPPKGKRGSFTRSTTNRKTGVTITRAVSPLKELIFFAFDTVGMTVVVGPMDYRNKKKRSYKVPSVLETGGTVHDRTPRGLQTKRYPGHPFMAPALTKTQGKFPQLFTDLLRG
jgi:hypothetical protein